ncbi:MAG: M28 family peptidase [Gemmatimonadales bacterium]
MAIDTLALRGHTRVLSHDSLRGRGTGDPGTRVAAEYIAAQCRAHGLEPVGASYFHAVPLADAGLDAKSTVIVQGSDRVVLTHGRDFLVTGGDLATLGVVRQGRAVWLGDLDSLPAALPMLGDVIGVTAGVPDHPLATRLAASGVLAVVALLGDNATLRRYGDAYGVPLRFVDPAPSSFFAPIPVVVGGARLTQALLPVVGGGELSVSVRLHPAPQPVEAVNVACKLRGTDPARADTAIAYTAHYDHLGVRQPVDGDSIYNGFSDNAAGVAMLLGIADAWRGEGGPRHTVLFLFFAAEERGLLGSDWWVAHPPWPLAQTRAVINLDAGAPPAPVINWRLAGGTASWLGALGRDVAEARGWTAVFSEPRANSDYFPFHRRGVPAVFPIPTPAPYEGMTEEQSQALRRRWDRYHHPGDHWSADFPFTGLARYAEYAWRIGQAVDRR